MEKENKDLLIKDLYSRFPYGVMCEISDGKTTITEELKFGGLKEVLDGTLSVKPYLRTMSSMTEKEVKEFAALESIDVIGGDIKITCVELSIDAIDWLNKKMFDYRGLIEKELALEAPETMYVHFGDMKTDIEVIKK